MIMKWTTFLILSSILSSCSVKTVRKDANPQTTSEELLQIKQEVSLSSDREELGKLRKDTPAETIQDNDELKFILDFFTDIRQRPSRIQSKFDKIVRRKQNKFRKKIRKQRQDYSKQERKDREDFLEKLKDERDAFMNSSKNTKEGRKDFFDEQDEQRKEYFANARDKRKDFEYQVREVEKDTRAYFREKKSQFRNEMRIFKRKHEQWKKDEKKRAKEALRNPRYGTGERAGSLYPKKKINPAKTALEREFEEMNKLPSEPMESQ